MFHSNECDVQMIDVAELNSKLVYLSWLQASSDLNFRDTDPSAPSTVVQVLWAVVRIDQIVFPAECRLETKFVGGSAPERAPFVSFKQNADGARLVAARSAAKYLNIFTERVRSFGRSKQKKSVECCSCVLVGVCYWTPNKRRLLFSEVIHLFNNCY